MLASSSLGSAGRCGAGWAQSGHRGRGHVSPRPLCGPLSVPQTLAVGMLASRKLCTLHLSAEPRRSNSHLLREAAEAEDLPGQPGRSSVLRQTGCLSKRSKRDSGVRRRPILLFHWCALERGGRFIRGPGAEEHGERLPPIVCPQGHSTQVGAHRWWGHFLPRPQRE